MSLTHAAEIPSGTKRQAWYQQMVLIRAFEQRVVALHKRSLIRGAAHSCVGMEAVAVGVCATLDGNDYITSTHRGHGHAIARGLDVRRMLAEILGRSTGYCKGKGGSMHITDTTRGMLGADGIVGGGIPIAVGAAMGSRILGRPSVVACFFGEGASNQGSFHEALNVAAIHKLPVVFVCENNHWALSASFAATTSVANVADRAAAYSMPGQIVDGNDVLAVHATTQAAVARARQGNGPSLIECKTYRWEGHSVFPRPDMRPADELDSWKQRDPIARLLRDMLDDATLDADRNALILAEVERLMDEAEEFALASLPPEPDSAEEDLYA